MKVGFSALTQSSYHVIPHIQKQLMVGIMEAGGIPVICRKVMDTRGLDSFVLLNSLSLSIQKEIFDNVPQYWTYLLDSPVHHAGWIWLGPLAVNYAVVDPGHLKVLSLLNRKGTFFPHGGDIHRFLPWRERDIDVLLTGTAPNLTQAWQLLEDLPLEQQDFTRDFIQEALGLPQQDLLQLFLSALRQSGNNMSVSDSMSVLTVADRVIRGTHRMDFLSAFSEFSMVVAGEGWGEIAMSPNHRWIGEIPYNKVSSLMSRAKIVLCPSCGFTQGAHDRILTAMGSGAVPLTMPTPYLSKHFQHGIHLAYFSSVPEAVDLARLILNGSHWGVVGEAGHSIVGESHSWRKRGQELFALLQGAGDHDKKEEGLTTATPALAAPSL